MLSQILTSPLAGSLLATESGPLEWKTDLALWTAVVFLVLLAVLWRYAWGPIADGLERRERGIAGQISEAQQANENAQRLLAEHQKKLEAASEEVRQLIAQGRRDAEQTGQRIVEVARSEAKAEQERALAEIDRATNGAIAELAAKSADLAVSLAGKIVHAQLRPGDHERLVREAVAGFTKSSKN
jgi:F-type H+-transporting ATPase subunit b